MNQRSTELANRFEAAVSEFARTVEGCTDEQWTAIFDAEGWTVATVAQRVSSQLVNGMMSISASAGGKPLPVANETRVAESGVTKEAVLKVLRSQGAFVAAAIRALSDEQLSTRDFIEGGTLISHVTEHLESFRSPKAPSASRA